ncbi:MAG: DNA polymerase III subunit alpha [Armatimonadetes bacterium]|nr:DNA polymerase III subunit alpha [Armatimonadota bacterium]
MGAPGFVHLHTHTEFSLLDGACRVKDVIQTAAKFEMPSVAITDHGVMYGNISFYSEAKAAGIKPILGCEVYVAPRHRTMRDARLDKEQHHLVLLAKSEKGYKNLIKMVSIAFSEGFYYKPRVDKELLAEYGDELIAMTACLGGEIPHHILKNNVEQVEKSLGEYLDIFGKENFYLEVMDNGLPEQRTVNDALVDMAGRTGLKLVATNDIHYTTRKDAEAHDVLLCIQTASTLDDPNRLRFGTSEFYMKSPDEMGQLFKHMPEALENTLEIAERCNVELSFGTSKLPDPGVPEGVSPSDHMYEQAWNGLAERMGCEPSEDYRKQFDYECKIISDCGFPLYMLIVRDFTDFARGQGMYIGARGSAASSLVGYGLGITDVDPIEYGLAFERFLNPERVELPDVDLDIQDDRRDELIQYVCEKYGRDHVGQIATFGSLKARAAVRDCGRVLGIDLSEVDRVCKMIPTIPVGIKIDEAMEANPDLKRVYESSREVKRLIDTAKTLEGINRNVGVHAAGVLISDDPLTEHVPVQSGGKGEFVAQMAKKDIGKVGLLKMDFLGLANLTILANAIRNVKKGHGIDIDIMKIPLDDVKTFEMLGRGDTNGVFQLEGAGMRRNVIELKPNSVRELAAIVALYRPGPMAFIPKFVKSKFGQEPITYLHPRLEPILEETYGVICYQEQVLRIACEIGGFTMGQADVLRKAMSNKNKESMDKQKEKFLEGAKANGISEKIALKIYEQVEPFAGYAFNKAHAVCYAFLAYRTGYMKANYPAEYYAALLSANMDDKDKLSMYIEDCKRFGIAILPPDVNASGVEFEVEGGALRFGLGAIKGVGRAVIESMVAARESSGAFGDLFDFCERGQDSVAMNKSTVECLIKVGAFASINSNRAQLLEMLPDAVSSAAARLRDQKSGQVGLFGEDSGLEARSLDTRRYEHVGDFKPEDIYAMEKDLVGLYLSGHPLDSLRGALEKNCSANAQNFRDLDNDQECVVGGIITEIRERITRQNNRMAFVKVEDLHGTIPVTFFPDALKNCSQQLAKDRIVLIKGRATHRERMAAGSEEDAVVEVEIRGESVTPVRNGNGHAKPNANGSRPVHIKLNGTPAARLETLKSLLEAYPGDSPVYFWMVHAGTRQKVATPFKVDATTDFVIKIQNLLGSGTVKVG